MPYAIVTSNGDLATLQTSATIKLTIEGILEQTRAFINGQIHRGIDAGDVRYKAVELMDELEELGWTLKFQSSHAWGWGLAYGYLDSDGNACDHGEQDTCEEIVYTFHKPPTPRVLLKRKIVDDDDEVDHKVARIE